MSAIGHRDAKNLVRPIAQALWQLRERYLLSLIHI